LNNTLNGGDRYFNQANKGVVIQGPQGKYPAMTANEYIQNAMQRNFARLEELTAMRNDS
jgi:hypothetical protein